MPEISTTKTPAQRAVTSAVRVATAARKAGSAAKKDRLMGAIFAGARTFLGAFARAMYAFWLQASGLIYVMFTVLAGSYLFKQYRANHYHLANTRPFWQVGAFFVVCLWFTVVSFWKAKKTMKGKAR
jgi:hypothetical protein